MKTLYFLLILSLSSLSNAWIIDDLGEFTFKKITDNVFVIHGPLSNPNVKNQGFMNNPGIVIGDTGIIVIDPGSTYKVGKNILKEIHKISKKPILAVFNTHIHGDHWLGNQAIIEQYPNAKIYAHPNMIAEAKDGGGDNWIKIMHDLTNGASKGTIATYPTDATSHLQVITIAGQSFKIHNPTKKAHTDTDIMVQHINSKTLFLGDNDVVHRHSRFDSSADIHGNIKVLKYAINLNLKHYVPGHGKSGNAKDTVQPFLDYLLIIQAETKKGYAQDLQDYEIKPFADKKLTDYQNWYGYKAQLGSHINKMLLEIEALDL